MHFNVQMQAILDFVVILWRNWHLFSCYTSNKTRFASNNNEYGRTIQLTRLSLWWSQKLFSICIRNIEHSQRKKQQGKTFFQHFAGMRKFSRRLAFCLQNIPYRAGMLSNHEHFATIHSKQLIMHVHISHIHAAVRVRNCIIDSHRPIVIARHSIDA